MIYPIMIYKQYISVLVIMIIYVFFVSASETEEIEKGKQLVKSKISCSSLSDSQLESIGEYYMELMHPGQLHEIMDQRMGGEGSESLRQAHINIAQMMYCGNSQAMPINMMNIMMNRGGFQNMMGYYGLGYGMMSYWQYGGWMMLIWIIIIIFIIYILFKYFKDGNLNFNSDPLEILKRRYAKGEITKKQFDQMKKELK